MPLLSQWEVQPVQKLSACTTVHFNFTYTSIPLWAVQPVQSLSARTTVHFNFTYITNNPMGRTACTESQCLYNGALYLYLYLYTPLWAVQPVQSLSASTTVHFNFTYITNNPMGRTACTEPQCLYNGAL